MSDSKHKNDEFNVPELPPYDPNVSYLDSYWQVFFKNEKLMDEIDRRSLERDELLEKIVSIKNYYD